MAELESLLVMDEEEFSEPESSAELPRGGKKLSRMNGGIVASWPGPETRQWG